MLFAAKGRGILLTVPQPLSGPQTKAEIQGFLLMYRLFLYQLWFFQKIEKGQRIFFFEISSFLGNRGNNLFSKIFLQRFSIFRKNYCQCRNKQYISRKPQISAFIWHPESGRGSIRRAPRPLAVKSIGARGVKKVVLRREGVTAPW